jgi:hypothetical protein
MLEEQQDRQTSKLIRERNRRLLNGQIGPSGWVVSSLRSATSGSPFARPRAFGGWPSEALGAYGWTT